MHVVYLAIVGDILTSVLLDVTDTRAFFNGRSRDARLEEIWSIYDDWCRRVDIPDRIGRRLFSTGFLKGSKFLDVPQKLMSAAASRYCIYFLASLLTLLFSWSEDAAADASLLWTAGVVWSLETMENLMVHNGPLRYIGTSDVYRNM